MPMAYVGAYVADREWMIISAEDHTFITARDMPKMVLIQPSWSATNTDDEVKSQDDAVELNHNIQSDTGYIRLDAPGMLPMFIPLNEEEAKKSQRVVESKVWRYNVKGRAESSAVNGWFSEFLGKPVILVRADVVDVDAALISCLSCSFQCDRNRCLLIDSKHSKVTKSSYAG